MSDEILVAAKREREVLLGRLAKNSDFQKLRQVESLISLYEAPADLAASAAKLEALSEIAKSSVQTVAPPHGARTSTITESAARYLRERGKRATSGVILKALIEHGVSVGGKKPSARLASYLSNSKLFDNRPGEGYGLVEWSEAATPGSHEPGATGTNGNGGGSPVSSGGGESQHSLAALSGAIPTHSGA